VTDPRDSIGDNSKESKGSILGRRRDGSATSSKMSITPGPSAGPTGNSNPPAVKAAQPKKKKSFLAMLCCGAPDDANEVEPYEAAVPAKVTKVGQRPTTASKPENTGSPQQDDAPSQQQTEKDALKQAESGHDRKEVMKSESDKGLISPSANGELNRHVDAHDQPPLNVAKESEPGTQSSPEVIVQAPDPIATASSTEKEKDGEGDTKMEDSEPLPTDKEESSSSAPRRDENTKAALPPPPPVLPPVSSEESVAPESTEGKQQWLLPPIAPRFKGKKCLVLDLDETLVHSSFKVFPIYPTWLYLLKVI
jgi:RNA polymerase II subunit A small phosphatase-like protein